MSSSQTHLLRLLVNAFMSRASFPKSSSQNLWPLLTFLLHAVSSGLPPSASAQSVPGFSKLTSSAVAAQIGTGVSCAWADYDNDGYPDLLVLHFLPQTNQLFHNNRDGTFTRITTGHLVTTSARTTGSSFGDYDGDGYLDLFITVEDGPSLLYHNDGGTNFALITNLGVGTLVAPSDGRAVAAGWADYNRDGHLDLFVIRPNAGGTNTLYRNNGNGTFTAMTPGAGAPEATIGDNNVVGFCSWVDVDNDGWPDLFIGGNGGALYQNLGGTNFLKLPSSVFDLPGGRSVVGGSWGDYDGDGLVDLVLGFDGGASSLSLYRNQGGGSFTKVSSGDLGTTATFTSTFPVWADANNDGFVDLFVGDAGGVNKFYRNNGNGTFTLFANGLDITESGSQSLAAGWADFNRDGWLDLFVNNGSPHAKFLYQNNGGANAWLSVLCTRLSANTASAIGATVRVQARIGGVLRSQTQQLFGGDGRRGPRPLVAHFGLGDATSVETLAIEWPGGAGGSVTQVWSGLAVRQHLAFSQSAVTPPIIFAQPASVVAASLPTNVVLTVSASGTPPLAYQWHSNGVPIAGANLASLTLPFSIPAPPQNYTVVITNVNGASTSSVAQVTFPGLDSDGDGLPDIWEVQFGLNPIIPADALSFPVVGGVTNKLTFLQIYQRGLDTGTLDFDNDGVTDFDETFLHGTNPKNTDSDGDGLPDGWEVQYGLNPRVNDTNESKSFDGVTNLQKYQWNQSHPNTWEHMFPNRAFSGTNTVSDYERFTGIRASRPVYDRNDRLIGVEYSSGVSLAYVYDGNGNLVRQKWISRASETNGLPALFSFLNNLTNGIGTGPYHDPDGDGWTNFQEQQAGTNPNDPLSKPDTAFNPGTNIAFLQLPFTPTNFVMAVGQLDGLGAEEIVIGADGNPGTSTNFIQILTQSYNGWATQRVDVGSFGVTSIAIGQPTNRNPGSIYLGLRQTGGTGRILELVQTNGVWQTNVVAASTSQAAFVLGVRATNDVLASLANNGLDGALYSLAFTTNGNVWNMSVVSTNDSRQSIGTHGTIASRLPRDTSMRTLSSGALELVGGDFELTVGTNVVILPVGATNFNNKWYFQTPSPMTWASAEAFCTNVFGHLVTIQSVEENSWLTNRYGGRNFWMGWFLDNYGVNGTFGWASGAGWDQGFMNQGRLRYGLNILYPRWGGFVYTDGWWGLSAQTAIYSPYSPEQFYGVGEIANSQMWTNRWLIPTPVGSSLELRGLTIASGPTGMNTEGVNSVFRLMIEDVNGSGVIDSADSLVLAGYTIQTNSWTTNTFIKVPITNTPSSQFVGVAVAKCLVSQPAILFTGEPDGQVFAWPTTNSVGPLQRQLFSSHHKGKAWHALAGVKLAEPGEGLAGLRVDPNNPSACNVIFWPPQPAFETAPSVPQAAPSVAIQPSPNAVASLAQVLLRLWDNEGNASLPMLEFQSPGGTVWSNATVLSIDGQMVGRVTALPTGSDHVLLWNAGRDLGAGFTNTVLLRARASDVTLTGDYSSTVSYRVEVSAGNPVANPDSTNTLQEVPVDIHVLANDTVQNGRTLSIVAYTQPANGTVSSNANQTLRYTPRTNFLGSDSFNYTISDGTGGTNIAVVTVTVLAVNHPPTPQSYAFTTAEDSPVSFAWNNDRDADGDLVTLLSVRSPSTAGGLVTLSGGVITYAPPPNFFGTDTFTFIVQDNGLTSGLPDPKQATNTVTMTVTPVNDAPVITAATNLFLLNEDAGLLFTGLSVSDPDAANSVLLANLSVTNGVLTLGTTNRIAFQAGGTNGTSNLVLQATLADLNAALTNLLYQGVTNFNGSDRLLITLDDQGNTGAGGPLRTTNVVWLTVNPVNDLPTAAITNLTNGQGFLTKDNILIQAEVRDLDGQIIRVDFLAGTNVIGSLTNAPYAVTFTNPPAATNLTLTVRATDDQGGVGVSQGVNITVRLPGLILLSPPVVSASRNVQLLLNNPDIGRQFRLEYSTDLKVWTAIGVAPNTNGTLEFNHTVPTNETSRFYRAVLLTQ